MGDTVSNIGEGLALLVPGGTSNGELNSQEGGCCSAYGVKMDGGIEIIGAGEAVNEESGVAGYESWFKGGWERFQLRAMMYSSVGTRFSATTLVDPNEDCGAVPSNSAS